MGFSGACNTIVKTTPIKETIAPNITNQLTFCLRIKIDNAKAKGGSMRPIKTTLLTVVVSKAKKINAGANAPDKIATAIKHNQSINDSLVKLLGFQVLL